MLADYHRTRPLLNGEVTARGIKLQPRRAESGEACMRPVYEEFDIAEMSLSWYMMARCCNEPVIALPIFPLRMQIHPYIFCGAASGIERPEDLKGKKIGMDEYRLTVGLWARGILREYHGVQPEDCEWFTSSPRARGLSTAGGCQTTVVNEPTEALSLGRHRRAHSAQHRDIVSSEGSAHPPGSDPRATVNEYYRKTRTPITNSCRPAIIIRRASVARLKPLACIYRSGESLPKIL
jgi:hypothetical protein